MLKIDFGSGYNPKKGFKTCDFTMSPFLDYITKNYKIYDKSGEIKEKSVNVFRCRNVLHHIKNIELLIKNFNKYLKKNGKLIIIDCRKEYYYANWCMDNLWYRYVIPRPEVWISNKYRNYKDICLKNGFKLKSVKYKDEKEIYIFQKN